MKKNSVLPLVWVCSLLTVPFAASAQGGAGEPSPARTTTTNQLIGLTQIREMFNRTALDTLRRAAQAGDPIAQTYLGVCLQQGERLGKNEKEAAEWLLKAAEQHIAEAQRQLGWMYEFGTGVPESRTAAMKWMHAAAEEGYVPAQANLGWLYANDHVKSGAITGNYPVAAEWYEKAAVKGHAVAQFELAELYHYGKLGDRLRSNCIPWYLKAAKEGHTKAQAKVADLPRYYPENPLLKQGDAVEMLRAAAEKGNVDAQFDLARRYQTGNGVNQDHHSAFQWMKKAAENEAQTTKVAEAWYYLAMMYEDGEGTPKDTSKAWTLYLQAAEAIPDAQYRVGEMYEEGIATQKNEHAAARYYAQAATAGWGSFQGKASEKLINLYSQGKGAPEDKKETEKQLRGLGALSPKAQYQLGLILLEGKVIRKDLTAAVQAFTAAARQNYAPAQNQIGKMWADGLQGEPDSKEAARWYRMAAVQGMAEAQFNLGLCYAKVAGVATNGVEAWQWLELAARQNFPRAAAERDRVKKVLTPEQFADAQAGASQFKCPNK